MEVKYDLVVDFARPTKSNTIIISEGDTNSRKCHFVLLNNKQPMSMSDITNATVRGVKKDGTAIFEDATIIKDADGNPINELEWIIPAACSDVAGNVTITITLMSNSNQMITSFEFYLLVRNALYNEDDLVSESDLSGFRDLLNRCELAVKRIEDLVIEDALPNPYPINITIEDDTYSYSGTEMVELELKNIAYIAEDIIATVDELDKSSTNVASESAKEAKEAADSAKTSAENAKASEDNAADSATDAYTSKNTASEAAALSATLSNLAQTLALKAEGYAVGTQNGVPVSMDSPYYENNAKYYMEGMNAIDNLDSTDPTRALSANQGRVLKDMIQNAGGASKDADLEITDSSLISRNITNQKEANHAFDFRASQLEQKYDGLSDSKIKLWHDEMPYETQSEFNEDIYEKVSQGGSTDVEWNQEQTTGKRIAQITIDGETTDVYAPNGSGASRLSDLRDVTLYNAGEGDLLAIVPSLDGTRWSNLTIDPPEIRGGGVFYPEDLNSIIGRLAQGINDSQEILTAGNGISIENNVISAIGGGGGTSDYNDLDNKPSINGVVLDGNKTSADLHIESSGTTSYYGTSAEFEEFKLRTDIPDGTEYIVTDDYVEPNNNVYSEEETLIGKWFDRNLYQKVVSEANYRSIASEWTRIATIENIDFMVDSNCYIGWTSSGTDYSTRPCYYKAQSGGVYVWPLVTSRAKYYILKYTKVGD